MIAIFVQTSRGLRWAANAPTEAEAQAQIDAGDFDGPDVDFVFIIEGARMVRDIDGVREAYEGSDQA